MKTLERTTANSKPLAALYTASGEPLCASLTNLAVFCTSRVRRIAEAMFTAMVECRGYLGQWWQCVEKDVVRTDRSQPYYKEEDGEGLKKLNVSLFIANSVLIRYRIYY